MRSLFSSSTLIASTAILWLTACQDKPEKVNIEAPRSASVTTPQKAEKSEPPYDAKAQYKKYAPVKMDDVDTSFLRPSERAVVNKLIEASRVMTAIYQKQMTPNFTQIRKDIKSSGLDNAKDIDRLYNLYFTRCDGLADGHVFFGDTPCPQGAGFYPEDMSRKEFNKWIKDHPKQADSFKSGYTLIRRQKDALVAIPYSKAYKKQLEKAAGLLREAADLSREPTLKQFLRLRADAFLSDDYYASELAWMDLKGNIEVAIGPYEVYDDGLFGYKTAFESFVTIKNPQESAALDKYKNYLRDMDPIVVSYQVQGGGDNVNGVQTIAFNLPNDERVREAKGAKKVILNNVLGAKYDRILAPIAAKLLVPEQAAMTDKKHMSYGTLFHELSHSLGPGTITKGGVSTTVAAELKELYTHLEEGKADVMGAYNVLYMMKRGELPISEKEAFLTTYFAGLFRSMRFGINAAHGRGAAIQYSYFRKAGAATWDKKAKRFRVDYNTLEQAITDLTAEFIHIQGDADYNKAKAFLGQYGKTDQRAKHMLKSFDEIPVDIRPIYPKGI